MRPEREDPGFEAGGEGDVSPLVCPDCHGPLTTGGASALACVACDASYPLDNGVADVSGGVYYDQFTDEAELSEGQRQGLALEEAGIRNRIEGFYRPRIEAHASRLDRPVRVLDSGCGNGLSVSLLHDVGVEAWGNDVSALRKWQWRTSPVRDRLVVAGSERLPFASGFFDVVISSGVIEHVGVEESCIDGDYRVGPRPDQASTRQAFVDSLLRVLAPGGTLFLDFPNGAFPIDFWHGPTPGGARFHGRSEGFLPTLTEVRRYARSAGARVAVASPYGRLRMRQVGGHWYGKLFRLPVTMFLHATRIRALRWLAATPANPYLVLAISRL